MLINSKKDVNLMFLWYKVRMSKQKLVKSMSSKENKSIGRLVQELPEDSLRLLDSIARSEGISQEEAIRKSLVKFFEEVEKTNATKETKRISVGLTNDIARMLELVSKSQGISQSETIRKAITLHAFLRKVTMQGCKVFIETPEGERSQLFFI